MIVIIEGPDGAGKTELAHTLCQRYNLAYLHEGPPPPRPADVLKHYGTLLNKARGKNILFDRLALGERVYGPIVRRDNRLTEEGWHAFARLIKASGAHQILCLPSLETCCTNMRERGETVNEPQMKAVHAAFGRLYETSDFVYDYTFHAVPTLHEKSVLPLGYLGSPDMKYLFVGERGNDMDSTLDLPFFGIGHSARYLNSTIVQAGYNEVDIGFVNAFDLQAEEPRYLIRRPGLKYIALGRVAENVCRAQMLPHHAVPHPQYWRRLHYHNMVGYAVKLAGARS